MNSLKYHHFFTRVPMMALAISSLFFGVAQAADLTVTVTNVINNRGHLLATLCDKAGFPGKCTTRAREPAAKGPGRAALHQHTARHLCRFGLSRRK